MPGRNGWLPLDGELLAGRLDREPALDASPAVRVPDAPVAIARRSPKRSDAATQAAGCSQLSWSSKAPPAASVVQSLSRAPQLDWGPATGGAVTDEAPGASIDDIERTLLDTYAPRF